MLLMKEKEMNKMLSCSLKRNKHNNKGAEVHWSSKEGETKSAWTIREDYVKKIILKDKQQSLKWRKAKGILDRGKASENDN